MKTAKRKKLKKRQFALPAKRKYPIDTKKRAANAKARATQQYKKGTLTKAQLQKIHKRADKVLGKS